jgi:predicted dehydrogenase
LEDDIMANIALLGAGLIGMFYTMALTAKRGRDKILVVCGANEEETRALAGKWGIPRWTTSIENAVVDPCIDVVVIGLPNNLHRDAALLAAGAGKAVLCTKPLGRTAAEAKEMLDAVEQAGVFHGYLKNKQTGGIVQRLE